MISNKMDIFFFYNKKFSRENIYEDNIIYFIIMGHEIGYLEMGRWEVFIRKMIFPSPPEIQLFRKLMKPFRRRKLILKIIISRKY